MSENDVTVTNRNPTIVYLDNGTAIPSGATVQITPGCFFRGVDLANLPGGAYEIEGDNLVLRSGVALADDVGEDFHEISSDSTENHVYLIYATSPEPTVNNSDAVVIDVSDSSNDTSQINAQIQPSQSQTSDVVGHLSGSSESGSFATANTPVHVNVPVMIEVLSDNNQMIKDVIKARSGRRSAMTRFISSAAQIICTSLGVSLGLKLGAPRRHERSNGTRV